MQDAFGGILSIVLIALFLIIVEGVLGFTVNYTKAFKMKNIVISAIEEYEDATCVDPTKPNTQCRKKILNGAKSIGYSPSKISCPSGVGWANIDSLFCVKVVPSKSKNKVYKIVTQVDVNIPIIRNIMGLSFFQVSGDTRVVQKQSG